MWQPLRDRVRAASRRRMLALALTAWPLVTLPALAQIPDFGYDVPAAGNASNLAPVYDAPLAEATVYGSPQASLQDSFSASQYDASHEVLSMDSVGHFPEAYSDCPECKPCNEQAPGTSLYWQDICNGGYRREEPLFHDAKRAAWYASAETMPLFRDQFSDTNVQPVVTGSTLGLGSRDLDTEFDNGVRLTLGRSLGDWYRLDLSWLGGYEWEDRVAANATNEFQSVGFVANAMGGEVNLRRRVRIRDWPQHYPDYHAGFEFSTLIGFRYFELDEQLNYSAQAAATTNVANVATTNQMAGAQIGALSQWLYEDRGWLDFEVKGAILSNEIGVTSSHTQGGGSPSLFQREEDRTSFLVDASLVFNYQFAATGTFRLGYNVIWIKGTALASENISSDVSLPVADIDHSGESIFHGPSIGVVFAR